ncbi:MAG TPA: ubiquitin-like domain-containing protein [Nakamurella sp.]
MNGRDDNPGHDGPELATAQNDLNDTNALNDQIDMTVPADSADNPASDDNNDREVVTQSSRPAHQADTSTGTKRSGLRRKVILVGAAATIGLLAVGGATAASLAKTVTITVDGQQRQVTTLAGSVDGALSSAGLQAGEHDVLAPAAGTHISDGAQIALEHGRLLTLTINGQERQVWTTAKTVDEALSQLGQDPNAYQLSADRAREIPLDGLSVTADPLRTVSLSDGGAAAAPVKTGGRTVADVLTGLNTPLGPTDTVVPDAATAVTDGLQITVSRITVTTSTDTVDIAPADQQVDDPNLAKGSTAVAQPGVPGKAQVVTQVTTVNGVETERKELSRTTVTEPTPSITHVGSKSTLDWQGSRVFFHDTEFGVNWDGMAYCESTNNPKAVNNPSGYLSTYGLFQFDLPTWASVGGSGNPLDASPEEQLVRAKLLYQSRGLEPWLCGYAASGPPAG